jgi:hypothetical protein
MSRNLVPMPARQQRTPGAATPPAQRSLPSLKTWHCFAFLILVALLIHWKLHYLLLVIAAFAGFCNLWLWLAARFPRTMTVINIIMLGLLRGGRRRW